MTGSGLNPEPTCKRDLCHPVVGSGFGAARRPGMTNRLRVKKIEQRRLGHHGLGAAVALGEKPLLLAAEPRLQIGAEMPRALHDAPADSEALRLEPAQPRLDR